MNVNHECPSVPLNIPRKVPLNTSMVNMCMTASLEKNNTFATGDERSHDIGNTKIGNDSGKLFFPEKAGKSVRNQSFQIKKDSCEYNCEKHVADRDISPNNVVQSELNQAKIVPQRPVFLKFSQDFDSRIGKLKTKLAHVRSSRKIKNDGKTISTGTSKANYIDPRIVFSWSKRNDVPIKKLFSQTLIKKYYWAEDVDEDFRF